MMSPPKDPYHGAVSIQTARFVHPWIGVERQQKSECRLPCHLRDHDLAGYRSVAVNIVDKREIGSLNDGELDYGC